MIYQILMVGNLFRCHSSQALKLLRQMTLTGEAYFKAMSAIANEFSTASIARSTLLNHVLMRQNPSAFE